VGNAPQREVPKFSYVNLGDPWCQAFRKRGGQNLRNSHLLRRDDLSAATRELIDRAPRYGEGTGFRMPVSSIADCADVEVVVEAKMG
jgi:hypothetical protein